MSNYNLLEFSSKFCKKNNHNQCPGQWEGFGFQVYCNCECHRKLVLDKAILKNESSNENNAVLELNNKGEFNR